eukprot:9547301-Alexandrium_andersonii.AAC.1
MQRFQLGLGSSPTGCLPPLPPPPTPRKAPPAQGAGDAFRGGPGGRWHGERGHEAAKQKHA